MKNVSACLLDARLTTVKPSVFYFQIRTLFIEHKFRKFRRVVWQLKYLSSIINSVND